MQLVELTSEKKKLHHEKIDLENQLEAEAEYIVNKLQKRVSPTSHNAECMDTCRIMLSYTFNSKDVLEIVLPLSL